MEKYTVGTDWKTPSDAIEVTRIGGYVLCVVEGALCVKGSKLVNLSKLPIGPVGIFPADLDYFKQATANKKKDALNDLFVIEDTIYFIVTFNGYAWIFLDEQDAYTMLTTITEFKKGALIDKYNKAQVPKPTRCDDGECEQASFFEIMEINQMLYT